MENAWAHSYFRVLGIIGIIAVTLLARDILLLGFVAILISVLLSFPVNFLSKRMARGFAMFLTLVCVLGGIGALGFFTIPQISDQVQSISKHIPDAVDRIQNWFSKVKRSEPVVQLPQGGKIADRLSSRVGGLLESGVKGVIPAAKGILGLMFACVFVIVLSIFLVANPGSYIQEIRKLIPKVHEKVFDETYSRVTRELRHWVGGILIAMTLMGTFTGIGLAVAGIENWLLLAVLTFFGTFVPYLGAITSAIPGLLIGLAQSPKHFLYACLVYLGVHILEGYVVEPLIMKRAVELKPGVLLVGQAVFATLFGILGVIVAAPLLACLQIMVQYLYVERKLGRGSQ